MPLWLRDALLVLKGFFLRLWKDYERNKKNADYGAQKQREADEAERDKAKVEAEEIKDEVDKLPDSSVNDELSGWLHKPPR